MALIGDMNYLTIGDKTYEVADTTARSMQLTATYTAATLNLELEFGTAEDADEEDF